MFHKIARGFSFHHMSVENRHRHRDIVTAHHPAFRLLRWHHKIDGKALLVKGKVPTGGTFPFQVETPWWSCLSHQNCAQKYTLKMVITRTKTPNSKKNRNIPNLNYSKSCALTIWIDRPLCYIQSTKRLEGGSCFFHKRLAFITHGSSTSTSSATVTWRHIGSRPWSLAPIESAVNHFQQPWIIGICVCFFGSVNQ